MQEYEGGAGKSVVYATIWLCYGALLVLVLFLIYELTAP